MPKFVRSAKGELIDFDLMALKAQMAARLNTEKRQLLRRTLVDQRNLLTYQIFWRYQQKPPQFRPIALNKERK
jgi:hypothetical protein